MTSNKIRNSSNNKLKIPLKKNKIGGNVENPEEKHIIKSHRPMSYINPATFFGAQSKSINRDPSPLKSVSTLSGGEEQERYIERIYS